MSFARLHSTELDAGNTFLEAAPRQFVVVSQVVAVVVVVLLFVVCRCVCSASICSSASALFLFSVVDLASARFARRRRRHWLSWDPHLS